MKTFKNTRVRRLACASLAGASALLLATVLALLPHSRSLAEPLAGLQVQKEVSAVQAAPGDTVAYTITIDNKSGSAVAGLWMTDTLPAELSNVSNLSADFGSFGYESGGVTWTGTLQTNQYIEITFDAQIASGITYAEIVNTAQVTGTGELITDSATTDVVGSVGNLDNTDTYKQVNQGQADPGDVLAYAIRLTNDSTDPVPNVSLTDRLPDELSMIGNPSSGGFGSVGYANGVVTWTGTLDTNQHVEVTFSAQISSELSSGTWITNTAEIVAPGQSFTRAVGTRIYPDYYLVYLPFIPKRWPPIPLAPTLNPINNDDGDGNYTVSWSYSYPDPPGTYTLQEATDENFTDPTDHSVNITSYAFTDKEAGTYYYRVRGHNTWGTGEWSNVESVTVAQLGYRDDFNNPGSGWTIIWDLHNPDEPLDSDWKQLAYVDGKLRLTITKDRDNNRTRWNKFIASPRVESLGDEYQLETSAYFRERVWLTDYGIIFGANQNFDKYYRLLVVYANTRLKFQLKRVDLNGPDTLLHDWTEIYPPTSDPGGWNTWRVVFDGGWLTVYLNNNVVANIAESAYQGQGYFGLWLETDEYTPAQVEFDYLEITPR